MSGLFGSGPKTSPERYAGIQVTTSMQGQVIPYVAGRQRVNMNLLWYGNFQSFANHSGGGKGGSPASSYTYSCAYIGALALGLIKGIHQVWYDKSATTLDQQNLAYALGASGQPTWGGYPNGTPAGQKIPYDHLAYVASSSYSLGSSAAMPDLTFEIEGVVGGYDNANQVYDADPSAIIIDYLTDPVHGAAFQGTIDTLTGETDSYQAYCMSLGLLVSPYENGQRAATDFMRELMQITNSDLRLSCGVLKVIPYADTPVSGSTPNGIDWSYTPDLTPVYAFTDDDFCPKKGSEPVKLKRKALSDTYNIVNLTFNDRTNYYDQAPASASDNYDISIRGPRAMSTLSFQQITQPSVAKIVAQLILQFQLYERNSYEFRVRADFSLLEPMDYISITDSGLGLTNQVCRITQIQDDSDNFITITAMEVPGTVRNTPRYNWNSAQGYYANFGVLPGNVATPAIFQMPPIPAAVAGIAIGIAAAPATVDTPAWGGCQVYCSTDGGDTYGWVGTIGPYGIPRYGIISAALSAVADPDTTSTLVVALQNTTQQLSTTVTHAQADANETLILVGTGNTAEVMSFGAASLVSVGNYDLSYLRRGLYGSTDQAHASGAPFVRLDGSIFQLGLDPGMAGKTIYFKFCSFNMVGQQTQDISSVTAYPYTVPQANQTAQSVALTARGNCVVNGEQVYKGTGSAAWDSDAVGAKPLTAGNISAQYGAGAGMCVGFATSVASIVNGATSMYGIFVNSQATATAVYENGTARYSGAAPQVGDLWDVRYDGFTLSYYINGALAWSTPLQGASLYPVIAMNAPGSVVGDVQMTGGATATPTQWKATGNCQVNDTNVIKQGGSSAWDSTAYSITGYQTCHVTAKPNSLSDLCMVGFSSTPTANRTYNNNQYCWYNYGGEWAILEGGVTQGTFGAVALTDVVWETYDGSNIRYYKNDPTTAIRTVALANATLYGYVPIYMPGSGWNSVRFGPTINLAVTDSAQLGDNAATDTYIKVPIITETISGTTAAPTDIGDFEIRVPAYPFAYTLVATLTGTVWNAFNSAQAISAYLKIIDETEYNGGVPSMLNSFQASFADATGNYYTAVAMERTWSVPANTAKTIYLFSAIYPNLASGNQINYGPASFKLEVKKK